MKRRDFLKTAGIAGGTALGGLGFPAIISAANRKPTIKVVGTHVTLQEEIRLKAEQDLGINIEFYPGGSAEVLLKASTDPDSFDLYEQWSNSMRVLWQAGSIQPIDISQLKYWNEINDLTKVGKISPNALCSGR
jgi:putative spermidine/putrescine transport system substrate-binding protein